MKQTSKWIILLLLIGIAQFLYGQNYPKNTWDTIYIKIPYRNIVASNLAFTEVKGLRLALYSSQRETYIANARNKFLENANKALQKSDSLCSEQLKISEKKFNTADIERLKISQEYRKQKLSKAIGVGIGLPVSFAVGLITGILIAPYIH